MAKEFKLKNPDSPMSFKQGIMIRNCGGGDVREEGLTMQEASDRISELKKNGKTGSKSKGRSLGDVRKMDRDQKFQTIWDEAKAAGIAAGEASVPTPMNVVQHSNPLDDGSSVEQVWHVPDGACGFAWVNVRPGTSAFAKWLKKMDYARTDSYYGGVTIWISEHGQSVDRKSKHAAAMASVFTEAGFNAYASSRLD